MKELPRCCRDSVRWKALPEPIEGSIVICRWCGVTLRFVNGLWVSDPTAIEVLR